MKRIVKIAALLVCAVLLLAGGAVGVEVARYQSSISKRYDVPLTPITRSTDPAVIERGHHLAMALVMCATSDCHGSDLSGGKPVSAGPLGTFTGPNITSAGRGSAYSDSELARLIRHGIKRDGHTVEFMPVQDLNWMSPDDVAAVISWVRSVPPVTKPDGEVKIGLLGKVLDRVGMVKLDIARHIDHDHLPAAPPPAPTPQYGAYLARTCVGCHGEHYAGGPIPGAPPSMAVPRNLTPDATGLKSWTFADFERVLDSGKRPNGEPLDPLMPFEALGRMNPIERQALWAFLRSLEPRPFGSR